VPGDDWGRDVHFERRENSRQHGPQGDKSDGEGIADLKRGKVLQDTIEKSVAEAVSGSNELITAKFTELASNLARRFHKVDKSVR